MVEPLASDLRSKCCLILTCCRLWRLLSKFWHEYFRHKLFTPENYFSRQFFCWLLRNSFFFLLFIIKVVFAVSGVVLCKLQEYLWVLHVLYEFSLNNAFKIIWDVQFWRVYTCLCFKHVSCVSKPHFVSYLIIEVDWGICFTSVFFKQFLPQCLDISRAVYMLSLPWTKWWSY